MSKNTALLDHFSKAIETGNKEDVEKALSEATEQSKLAMSLFAHLSLAYPDLAKDYCKTVSEIPSVYSCDDSKNKMHASVAKGLGLGEDFTFNYKGDRPRGIVSKLAVERAVEIIKELNLAACQKSNDSLEQMGAVGSLLIRIKNLGDLSTKNLPEWRSVIVDYVMMWNAAEDSELSSKLANAFPYLDLMRESRSYAESRIQSRKEERLKNLHARYPDGAALDEIWKKDQGQVLPQEATYLTKYQVELKQIEAMPLDYDCWHYAISRLVGERLKRLLR
jgi:hypothetical protein